MYGGYVVVDSFGDNAYVCVVYHIYITVVMELSGNERCKLSFLFLFTTAHLEIVALITSRIT